MTPSSIPAPVCCSLQPPFSPNFNHLCPSKRTTTQYSSSNLADPRLFWPKTTEVVISPPALYLLLAREHLRAGIEVAAQNVFDKPNGAFTGEISAEQLMDSGITWTILGHSERRMLLNESDDFVASKTNVALDKGLNVILCCGESLEVRDNLFSFRERGMRHGLIAVC